MLFYFTSLYVARQFETKPISISKAIHLDKLVFEDETIGFEDETIGIVWPIYAGEPPKIVLDFLKKVTFKTNYLYMILTYGKNDSDAPEYINHLCQQFDLHIDYIHSILMVDNYLPSFDMNEQKVINKNIDAQLKVILANVKARKK